MKIMISRLQVHDFFINYYFLAKALLHKMPYEEYIGILTNIQVHKKIN